MRLRFVCTLGLILLASACIDPYQLEVIPTGEDYLVVDGFINSGEGLTTFKLSHLQNLNDEGVARPEVNAQVTVESDAGETFLLAEAEAGLYSNDLPVDPAKQYRIRINTTDGKEYLSEFVEVKYTPPIDSITWDLDEENRELNIYVTTHDPDNDTHFYKWDYDETWNFKSTYITRYAYRDGEFIYDTLTNKYSCWKTESSTRILTSSSAALSTDVVNKFPLTSITPESDKARILYSILVKQHALTSEAYQYWQDLKKFTELKGSIFDPLPARINGNIVCISNPDEPVIGFISTYSIQKMRIFISDEGLPIWFSEPYPECPEKDADMVRFLSDLSFNPTLAQHYLKSGVISPYYFLGRWFYELTSCVDCRAKKGIHAGGTNVKPDFWP